MKLIPIPPDKLEATAPFWLPFLEVLAKRQRCSLDQRLADLINDQVRLLLIWDEKEQVAKAMVGISIMQRGDDKVARIVWNAGKDLHLWIDLLPELEQWSRNAFGCVGIEIWGRLGWTKVLKRFGYRVTHVQLEKDF